MQNLNVRRKNKAARIACMARRLRHGDVSLTVKNALLRLSTRKSNLCSRRSMIWRYQTLAIPIAGYETPFRLKAFDTRVSVAAAEIAPQFAAMVTSLSLLSHQR